MNTIIRRIRNNDAFGHPITLSYKDSSTYKSVFGGIVTLFSRIALFAYFLVQIISVWQRQTYNIATSTTYENLSVSGKQIILNTSNFDIGLGIFRGENYTYSLDYFEYFSINFIQWHTTINQGVFSLNRTSIPGEICQNDRFLGDKVTIENLALAQNSICPQKDFNFELKDSMSAQEGSLVYIHITPCIQSNLEQIFPGQNRSCKSVQEIQSVSQEFGFDIIYSQQYVENKNFDTPIKYFTRYYTLNYQNYLLKSFMFQIYPTIVDFHDSIFSSELNVVQRELYQVDNIEQFYSNQNDPFKAGIQINIVVSEKRQEIVRTVDTILTAITNTGGFMSILLVVIQILTASIQEKMFYQSLISKMYYYHEKPINRKQNKKKARKQPQSYLENDISNSGQSETKERSINDNTIYQSSQQTQIKDNYTDIIFRYIQELQRPQFSL
eukprot:403338865